MACMPDVSIVSHFKDLSDPRIERAKKHRLIDIIVIALPLLQRVGCQITHIPDPPGARYQHRQYQHRQPNRARVAPRQGTFGPPQGASKFQAANKGPNYGIATMGKPALSIPGRDCFPSLSQRDWP